MAHWFFKIQSGEEGNLFMFMCVLSMKMRNDLKVFVFLGPLRLLLPVLVPRNSQIVVANLGASPG